SVMNERGDENFTPNYTGKFFDESSGLYYFNARWYDCELGRFTTQDPARDGVNWWAYCGGNPITFVDPDGREIINAYKTLMTTSDETLGKSSELISKVGCVLTAYTRIASAIIGDEISLNTANQIAKDKKLFTDGNLLTPENGAELINSILEENGIIDTTVSFEGSYTGIDAVNKYQEANKSETTQHFATARINTHDTSGNKYDHTVNLDADAYQYSRCGENLKLNDTSGVRTQLVDDPSGRKNKFLRMDFFIVNMNNSQENQ
ncbi:MAG: RHS repeat-associated core domain-containing protein, partial [Treponema sp.]|nr:RHS repeat-associated core domain-containing protein [Clostridia bacterium]MBP3562182.1 RHS repeat-associated core domain-containing protein [Treponema sp.]MBP3606874.1 RHS repeat-associated core domain-containing protein [Treponema sp.]